MKIIYTSFSLHRMYESLAFLQEELEVPPHKTEEIKEKIRSKIRLLVNNPHMGQKEFFLHDLKLEHRRLIVGSFKIIYYIQNDTIFITDIFDSRQDPDTMKG